MSITASAPGKLVLFGDHAVVYGHPCIVTAVDLRFYVTIAPSDQSGIQIETPQLKAQGQVRQTSFDDPSKSPKETAFVEAAIREFSKIHQPQAGIRITTDGPEITFGLGSSSAITVAMIKALAAFTQIELSMRDIFEMAYQAVLNVQGAGSGVDVAAAVCGKTVYYVKGGSTMELLETPALPIIIGYSGEKVPTTNYLTHVKMLQATHAEIVNQVFNMMGSITEDAKNRMLTGDWQQLGALANLHQGLLDTLGVTTPQLFLPIYAARTAGGWGAKLSGAGGGDCMFTFAPPDKRPMIADAIEKVGGQVVDIAVGAQGVRIEESAR